MRSPGPEKHQGAAERCDDGGLDDDENREKSKRPESAQLRGDRTGSFRNAATSLPPFPVDDVCPEWSSWGSYDIDGQAERLSERIKRIKRRIQPRDASSVRKLSWRVRKMVPTGSEKLGLATLALVRQTRWHVFLLCRTRLLSNRNRRISLSYTIC